MARMRKTAGRRQSDIAERMGVAQSRISAIEAATDLQVSTITRYCKACGFDSVPLWIITGKGET